MSTIIEEVARTLWVQWWAREHERRAEEDGDHRLPWGAGGNLEEHAPETPPEAYVDAGRVVGMVEERNGLQVDAAWARALGRDGRDWESLTDHDTEDSKKEFAYCLAMESLGSGVSWADDHEDHGLEVPQIEFPGYMPEVFSGVACSCCGEDAGAGWEKCNDCGAVVCRGCMAVRGVRCVRCRTWDGCSV